MVFPMLELEGVVNIYVFVMMKVVFVLFEIINKFSKLLDLKNVI